MAYVAGAYASTATAATIGYSVAVGVTVASIAHTVRMQRKQKKAAEAARREAQKRAEAIRIALSRSQIATPSHHFARDSGSFSQYNSAVANFRDSITPRRIVYGTRKLGGPILFAHNTSNTVLHLVVALAAHKVEEIGKVYVGKEEVTLSGVNGTGKWSGYVRVQKYTGTQAQNIGTSLISLGCNNVKTSDKWKGIAALQVRTTQFSQKFEGSPEFSAMVKGKNDIFDPRTNVNAWTDNSALIVADYLHTYMGVSYDDINTDALIQAANICDEDVHLLAVMVGDQACQRPGHAGGYEPGGHGVTEAVEALECDFPLLLLHLRDLDAGLLEKQDESIAHHSVAVAPQGLKVFHRLHGLHNLRRDRQDHKPAFLSCLLVGLNLHHPADIVALLKVSVGD